MAEIDYRRTVDVYDPRATVDSLAPYFAIVCESRPTHEEMRVIELHIDAAGRNLALFLDESEAGELLDAIGGALRAISAPAPLSTTPTDRRGTR